MNFQDDIDRMSFLQEERMKLIRQEICKKYQKMTGRNAWSVGMDDILKILCHPDMIDLTANLVALTYMYDACKIWNPKEEEK